MDHLKQFWELDEVGLDFEFETRILERNKIETDLLIKKGYKIKKSIWTGLIAS